MKTGFVALVGLPNAGKSTLVNALIGEKVGIISTKPQTTRKRVIGVYNDADSQICFADTPGRVKAEVGLNQFLEKELLDVMRESDMSLAILNLDARKFEHLEEIVALVKASHKPWAAVITKTDLDSGLREGKLRATLLSEGVPVVSISALKKPSDVKTQLLEIVKERLPTTDAPLYDQEIFTTQSTRDLVAEIVREKCFEYLHQEIPYGIAVKVIKYDEDTHDAVRAWVEILVAKDNFLPMVVGAGGQTIKRIGASARIECEKIVGRKMYLETRVKVKKDWTKNPQIMKELGYVITE